MQNKVVKQLHLMGTVIDITVVGNKAEEIVEKTVRMLEYYEKMFSANDDTSELMKINFNAGKTDTMVSPELYNLISLGKYHSIQDDSFLNIAIGPLIKEWKIGFEGALVPSKEVIESLLRKTNPEKIILSPNTHSIYLEDKQMEIDLGALAKGFIADKVVEYYKQQDITSAILNLGGNVVVYGESHHPDGYFRVGIQHPTEPRSHCLVTIQAKNESIVTSGIYERTLTVGKTIYHHIINPKTGYPIETDVASLTIISKRSVDGEIWTTRLFGKNTKDIISTVNQLDAIECVVIDKTNKVFTSEMIKTKLM